MGKKLFRPIHVFVATKRKKSVFARFSRNISIPPKGVYSEKDEEDGRTLDRYEDHSFPDIARLRSSGRSDPTKKCQTQKRRMAAEAGTFDRC